MNTDDVRNQTIETSESVHTQQQIAGKNCHHTNHIIICVLIPCV